jgi:hypothetical protein
MLDNPDALEGANRMLADHVRRYSLAVKQDARGSLWPIEFSDLPFTPVRAFLVHGSDGAERGGHGHTSGKQLLICVSGSVLVETALRDAREAFELKEPGEALFIQSPVWARQIYRTPDARLLVLADTPYNAQGYIHHVPR